MNVLIGVGAQVKLARLMLITDTRRATGDLESFLEDAVMGGVDLIQIREAGLDPAAELAALRTAWDVAARHRHLVVVSDSAELAADFGADVVHLGDLGQAKELATFKSRLGRFTRLGATAGNRAELERLVGETAIDFILVDAADDLELVRVAARTAPVADLGSKSWYALGEFDLDRLEQAVEAGVRRIAVTSTLTESEDPRGVARQLSGRLREVWATDDALTRFTFQALAEQA